MKPRRPLTIILSLLILSLYLEISSVSGQEVVVVDDFGRRVVIPRKPMRIVSTAPSITEILFALGIGDRVVGVTKYCNYPPEVLKKASRGEIGVIGGFTNPVLEKIVDLEPDLVFGHNLLKPEFVKRLEDLGIPVVVVKTAESVDGVYHDIELIGRSCWETEASEKLIGELKKRINFWSAKVEGTVRVKTAYIAWINPLWVAGNRTYINDLITLAGGMNIFSDLTWWKSVSDEELVRRDPEHIIVPYRTEQPQIREYLLNMKNKGLIHGEIHGIDPDIVSRPGPRMPVALEEIIKFIHPEIWGKVLEVKDIVAPETVSVGDTITIYLAVKNPGSISGIKTIEANICGRLVNRSVEIEAGEEKIIKLTSAAEAEGICFVKAGEKSKIIKVVLMGERASERSSTIWESLNAVKSQLVDLRSRASKNFTKLEGDMRLLRTLIAFSIILSMTSIGIIILMILRGGLSGSRRY